MILVQRVVSRLDVRAFSKALCGPCRYLQRDPRA